MRIENTDQLVDLYGTARGRAKDKVLEALEKHCINFIGKSPFLVLSSFNSTGQVDASPRGGSPGFVKVLDEKTIAIPDGKGNNRLDSFRNIVDTGRAGLLFLIPGMDETLRLNGTAYLTTEASIIDLFTDQRHRPKTCLIIEIEEVFLHCAKALMRSELWSASSQIERSELPTIGQMLKDQLNDDVPPESQEAMVARYKESL
ncbi:MAG: pyridoxamine 5'-phosphate oxidase family protein [Roseivirga sp.]|nr:pyridoxamine 5'-phosphate oxidase family protein [Roseivirga sp.]